MSLSLLAWDYEKKKTHQFLAVLAMLFVIVLDIMKFLQSATVEIQVFFMIIFWHSRPKDPPQIQVRTMSSNPWGKRLVHWHVFPLRSSNFSTPIVFPLPTYFPALGVLVLHGVSHFTIYLMEMSQTQIRIEYTEYTSCFASCLSRAHSGKGLADLVYIYTFMLRCP